MDYGNLGDLTNHPYYGPIKISRVQNPYEQRVNNAIFSNCKELEQILNPRDAYGHKTDSAKQIEALKRFFQKINTEDNIRNLFCYGDSSKKSDQRLSKKLSEIDRKVQDRAKQFGKKFPFYRDIQTEWNILKHSILCKEEALPHAFETYKKTHPQNNGHANPALKYSWDMAREPISPISYLKTLWSKTVQNLRPSPTKNIPANGPDITQT